MKYDIAIIGGGPAGYTAAERAAANGLQTVLFEKKAIGGVCLNEGCIPTKTLLYSAKLWDNMKGAFKYGISVPDGSSFDMKKIIDRKDKIVKKLTGGVKMTVSSYGAVIVPQEAVIMGEADGRFQLSAAGEAYEVTYLLVCTGSDTLIPPIKDYLKLIIGHQRKHWRSQLCPVHLSLSAVVLSEWNLLLFSIAWVCRCMLLK